MTRPAFQTPAGRRLLGIALAGLVAASASAAPADRAGPVSLDQRKAARLASRAGVAAGSGETWKALALLRKAAALAPNDARYRSSLGQAYLSVNLYGSAAASFGDALALDAADSAAQQGWAVAQTALGRSHVRFALYQPGTAAKYRTAAAE